MNKLLLCMSAGFVLTLPYLGQAQLSIQSHQPEGSPLIEQLLHNNNYIRLSTIDLTPPIGLISSEDAQYIKALTEYIKRGDNALKIVEEFCSDYPQSIDLQRARLLLGIAYHLRGQDADALAQLNTLDEDALYQYEQDKCKLLRGYLYAAGKGIKPDLNKATALLQSAEHSRGLWGEQAKLYRSNLLWAQGKSAEAVRLLEQGSWSAEIMPEVEYTGALLAYSRTNSAEALRQTDRLLRAYPQMAERPRLIGLQAWAYNEEKEYSKAIALLEPLRQKQDVLLPEEYYTLGHALYELGRYDESLPYLQKATLGEGSQQSFAQFSLGAIYRLKKEPLNAQLAFEQVVRSDRTPEGLRESALFQLIELGYAGGQDAFGGQIKRVEQFLSDYPQSIYRTRVMELLAGYINRSTAYESADKLIDRLSDKGIKLTRLKQSNLVRWAESLGNTSSSYLPLLTQAIALGNTGDPSYFYALTLRAETLLALGRYDRAEADALKAQEQSQTKASALYLLGYARYNQKKYSSAAEGFLKIHHGDLSDALYSDALLRAADCLSEAGKSAEAIELYRQADNARQGGSEEALYRLALLYSKLGRHGEQIQTARTLDSKYPQSPFRAELLYRRGRAELLMGKSADAIASLTEVGRLYPASPFAPTALLEKALIEGNNNHEDEAVHTYKNLINLYPESKEAESALSDLRSIYGERNALDEYATFVRSIGRTIGQKPEDEAHLSFISIESKIRRGEAGTTTLLEQYLKDFPKGSDRLEALKLLVRQYQSEGRSLDALTYLKEARSVAKGEDAIALALEEGDLQKSLGHNREAYASYLSAYKSSEGTKMYSLKAGLASLRTASREDAQSALPIADALLKRSTLTVDERGEISLLKGKLLESTGMNKQALETYSLLYPSVDKNYGAEATVRGAELSLKMGQTASAEKLLKNFVASGSSQSYWLARAFITLSDCYEKQGEQYLAKQYIESLQENYTGDEADIQSMITDRLKRYNRQ